MKKQFNTGTTAGKLIVLEGTDGCGKSTQMQVLKERLVREHIPHLHVAFPRYSNESSTLVRMYLSGKFGTKPDDVPPELASTFFSLDRWASFTQEWGDFYRSGGVVLVDRYTTSNAIHQGAKVPEASLSVFLDWLGRFEYDTLGLPEPDEVIFLDVPTELAVRNLRSREGATKTKADIHEQDTEYLRRCRETALFVAERQDWTVIPCADNTGDVLRLVSEIHEDVYNAVMSCIRGDRKAPVSVATSAGHREGVCPNCGHTDLEYPNGGEVTDCGIDYQWVCPKCGASGTEVFERTFISHEDVTDKNGEPLPKQPGPSIA